MNFYRVVGLQPLSIAVRVMKSARATVMAVLIKHFPKEKSTTYEKAIFNSSLTISGEVPDRGPDVDTYVGVSYERIAQLINAVNEIDRAIILVDMQNSAEGEAEVSWRSCVYDDHKDRYQASLDRSQRRPKPVKGMHICKDPKCKSDEFYLWSSQDRGGDEGMCHHRQCARCGKRGKE
jgi:DNA-directed RNA polymerase subunit M/transcription elongation factor TFIIS